MLSFSACIKILYYFEMDVSLPDQYVLLLQNVVDENKLLREQMKQTIEQGKNSLEEIKKKVDTFATSSALPSRRVRQTGRPIRVPRICSVSPFIVD